MSYWWPSHARASADVRLHVLVVCTTVEQSLMLQCDGDAYNVFAGDDVGQFVSWCDRALKGQKCKKYTWLHQKKCENNNFHSPFFFCEDENSARQAVYCLRYIVSAGKGILSFLLLILFKAAHQNIALCSESLERCSKVPL